MNTEKEEVAEDVLEDDIFERHQNDLMEMFEEASFGEKWRRVFTGLKMPYNSGPHKWARLQMMRLISPVAAVVVPLLLLLLVTVFSRFDRKAEQDYIVTLVPQEQPETPVELPKFPDPVKVEPIDVDIDVVSFTPDPEVAPSRPVGPPQTSRPQSLDLGSVAKIKCVMQMRGIYSGRASGARGAALRKFNAAGSDIAVLRALRYLKKNQRSDGSWGKDKVAMTSLALLAYLAHAETPGSAEFGETVKSAMEYILSQQKENGFFRGADQHQYTQPIAAYALAEAFAMTRIPKVKSAAIKALVPVVNGQNPSGGFNYNLKPSERDDTSYMGWCVQALKSGKMAGLYGDVPGLEQAMHRAAGGFRKNFYTRGDYGAFAYTKGSDISSGGLTGVGVLCLQFLGDAGSRECRSALRSLADWRFNWDTTKRKSFVYYMYYTTQALFMEGGKVWKQWDRQFQHTIMNEQDVIAKDNSGYVDHEGVKHAIGSWISPSPKEHNGGNPVMDTILCTLMLEVYYRYLTTSAAMPEQDTEGDSDGDLELDFGYITPKRQQRDTASPSVSLQDTLCCNGLY